ncbi:MAG: retropepsin-like aspartic protease [Rhizomicrobium sp.]
MFRHARAAALSAALALGAAQAALAAAPPPAASTAAIPMKKDGGVYVVPVTVNGLVTIDCIVDSGASDVNIPAGVYRKLQRAGAIQQSDLLGTEDYTLADGSTEHGRVVRIRTLKVGNIVVHDVTASIGGDESSALLGQSFLERFRSWSLDNGRHALVLNGVPSEPAPRVARDGNRPVPAPHAGPSDDSGAPTVAQISSGHGGHVRRPPPKQNSGEAGDENLTGQYRK